jgi:uncharacterized Zn finger protein
MPINFDLEKLIDYLKLNPMLSPKHCSNCGHAHSKDDLHVMGMQKGELTFQLACTNCGLVQVVRMTPGGPMTIQRLESNNSDISAKEFAKFAGKPTVAKEEALQVYADMQNVNNLEDLLTLMNETVETEL